MEEVCSGAGDRTLSPAFYTSVGRVEKPSIRRTGGRQTTKDDRLPHDLQRLFMKFRGPQALGDRPRKTMACPTLACAMLVLSAHVLTAQTGVLTYHNDNQRTGVYPAETLLAPGNVNASAFGKLFVIAVDGKVDAQPLYAPALSFPGRGTRNALYVVTELEQRFDVPCIQPPRCDASKKRCHTSFIICRQSSCQFLALAARRY